MTLHSYDIGHQEERTILSIAGILGDGFNDAHEDLKLLNQLLFTIFKGFKFKMGMSAYFTDLLCEKVNKKMGSPKIDSYFFTFKLHVDSGVAINILDLEVAKTNPTR